MLKVSTQPLSMYEGSLCPHPTPSISPPAPTTLWCPPPQSSRCCWQSCCRFARSAVSQQRLPGMRASEKTCQLLARAKATAVGGNTESVIQCTLSLTCAFITTSLILHWYQFQLRHPIGGDSLLTMPGANAALVEDIAVTAIRAHALAVNVIIFFCTIF